MGKIGPRFPLVLLLLVTSVSFSPLARADCGTEDLNAARNSPFRSIPIYDQDGSGTCYSYAASQLVDYYRIQHGADRSDLINPVYATWVYSSHSFFSRITRSTEGGSSVGVINALRAHGYCKKQRVEACLKEFKEDGSLTDAEVLHFLEAIYQNYTHFTLQDSTQLAIKTTENDASLNSCTVDDLSNILIQKHLMDVPATEVLKDLFQDCQPPTPLKDLPAPYSDEIGSDHEVQSEIDASLDHQEPVGVGICSEMLDNPSYRGMTFLRTPLLSCSGHGVTITARKEFSDGCKYLVRNSWGALWHPDGVPCACITALGKYEDVCTEKSVPEEYVGCWYNRKDVVPNTIDLVTFFGSK